MTFPDFEHLLQDSYENPVPSMAVSPVDRELNLNQLATTLKLSVDEFVVRADLAIDPGQSGT